MQTDSSTGEGSSSRKTKSQYMTSKPSETSPLLGRNGALDYDSTYSKRKDKFRARSSRNDQHDNSLEHDRHGNESNARPNFVQELITWGRGRWQLCSVLISLLCISLILVAALLLLTPEYAQRSLEDGMQVNFREASIVNATENGDVSILTLHIVGELLLQNLTYKLAKRTSWLLGDINTRPSHLQIYYIPKTSEQYQQNEQQQLMGTITLPSLTISSRSPITQFSFDTQFVISNASSLMNFCIDAVASPEVSWKVSGPVELQLGWFSPSINLQRQVTLDGMDGLKEASIQSISFPGAHPLGGISLEGAVAIYNPSSMLSLTLGDVDFGIFLPDSNSTVSDDMMIAVVLAKDAALLGKRHNTFNISGRSLPLDDSNIRGKRLMENFLSTYLRGNDSIVHVRGSPFGPDQNRSSQSLSTPKWLQKALQLLTIAVPFPGTKETELIQSLELTNIKIDFSSQGDPLISGDVAALLKKPKEMQFSMNVTSILPHVYLYPQQNSSSPFGQLIPDEPCPATTKEGDGSKDVPFGTLKVLSKIQRAPFRVLPGKDDDFQKFLNEIFYGRGGKVYIRGNAEAQVDSPFGLLNIHDLAFRGEIDTKGMKGLTDPPPEATSISLIRGDPDALHLSCVLLIHNPSDVDINLGQLNVLLEYDSQVIGDATIEEMHLLPERRNEYVAAGRLLINGLPNSPSSSASPMIDFIGDYISGEKNVSLTISGRHPNATASDLLKLLIHNLEFTVEPPMFEEQPLLEDMQMNILSSTTIMWLCNPFENIVIQLLNLNGTARYESHNIGTAVADFENLEEGWEGPIVLPPLACQTDPCMSFIVETPKIPVMAKKLGFDAIRKALGGEISISVASWLKIKIDQLELEDLRYQRNNLTMKVRKGF